jgi:hypothetical protein
MERIILNIVDIRMKKLQALGPTLGHDLPACEK